MSDERRETDVPGEFIEEDGTVSAEYALYRVRKVFGTAPIHCLMGDNLFKQIVNEGWLVAQNRSLEWYEIDGAFDGTFRSEPIKVIGSAGGGGARDNIFLDESDRDAIVNGGADGNFFWSYSQPRELVWVANTVLDEKSCFCVRRSIRFSYDELMWLVGGEDNLGNNANRELSTVGFGEIEKRNGRGRPSERQHSEKVFLDRRSRGIPLMNSQIEEAEEILRSWPDTGRKYPKPETISWHISNLYASAKVDLLTDKMADKR